MNNCPKGVQLNIQILQGSAAADLMQMVLLFKLPPQLTECNSERILKIGPHLHGLKFVIIMIIITRRRSWECISPPSKFLGVKSELSLGTRDSNLKSVALTVLELLAFNAQKFRGSRDPGHAPFGEIFGGHVRAVSGNKCVKFEVCSFNRFRAVSI